MNLRGEIGFTPSDLCDELGIELQVGRELEAECVAAASWIAIYVCAGKRGNLERAAEASRRLETLGIKVLARQQDSPSPEICIRPLYSQLRVATVKGEP